MKPFSLIKLCSLFRLIIKNRARASQSLFLHATKHVQILRFIDIWNQLLEICYIFLFICSSVKDFVLPAIRTFPRDTLSQGVIQES